MLKLQRYHKIMIMSRRLDAEQEVTIIGGLEENVVSSVCASVDTKNTKSDDEAIPIEAASSASSNSIWSNNNIEEVSKQTPAATVISATEESDGSRKRIREEDMTEEERLEDRRAKNRLSAHQSRLRKRSQLKYMQTQVVLLSEENNKLMSTNQTLVSELARTRNENARLRLLYQDSVRAVQTLRAVQGIQGTLQGNLPF